MKKQEEKLSKQMKKAVRTRTKTETPDVYEGNTSTMISTGSTLLDLAISGGRVRGGGIPGGILVEVFGPSSSGKTVLLSEIAGNIQRMGGNVMFNDPEARLDAKFAQLFGVKFHELEYTTPDTVTEVFSGVRKWTPEDLTKVNGVFADSLAALSTDLEMSTEDGDKMGMRRPKEFSEQLRRTCRILQKNNYLMVCSNQVRVNTNAGAYGQKYTTPGGLGVGFYSSLRLRTKIIEKIKAQKKFSGVSVDRFIGVRTEIEVHKSSVWKPYRTAPLTILFDYGIDDIRENLQFVKDYTKATTYMVRDENLGVRKETAINKVESMGLEQELREQVIDLWTEIEAMFDSDRKPKMR